MFYGLTLEMENSLTYIRYGILKFHIKLLPYIWLRDNCDVINTKNVLFLETNKGNQFMQFSIGTNTAKLLFIHLVLT